jgi:hypothetical protein
LEKPGWAGEEKRYELKPEEKGGEEVRREWIAAV